MKVLAGSQIKLIQKLRERSFRYETKKFWAEGERTLTTLLDLGCSMDFAVTVSGEVLPQKHFPPSMPVYLCPAREVTRIKATTTFPGVAGVFHMPEMLPLKGKRIIALDRINTPGNLGTMFRTALWIGIRNFLIDSKSVDTYHEKMIRGSMVAVAGIHV
jgi:RNA methyltransferase, TrmH family